MVLVGSLAKGSINRKLAKALTQLAPDGMEFHEISFAKLPLYSYDYDQDYPAEAQAFKAAIKASDAILFVTPEYNRSIPGGLKNAIDWASRPYEFALGRYIDGFYNPRRRHSALGYKSPASFEAEMAITE